MNSDSNSQRGLNHVALHDMPSNHWFWAEPTFTCHRSTIPFIPSDVPKKPELKGKEKIRIRRFLISDLYFPPFISLSLFALLIVFYTALLCFALLSLTWLYSFFPLSLTLSIVLLLFRSTIFARLSPFCIPFHCSMNNRSGSLSFWNKTNWFESNCFNFN
jgi:hypothetical protein